MNRVHRLSMFLLMSLLMLKLQVSNIVAQEAKSIVDGQSLDGWVVCPAENSDRYWKVDDHHIIASNDDGVGSNLWTKTEYRDYELQLEYKSLTDDYDTGVFLRGDGHQVQIGYSGSLKCDMTGCIYAPQDKLGGYPGKTDKIEKFHKVGQWNQLRIIVRGKRIETFLNGEPFVDYTSVNIQDSGPIGLQLHPGRPMQVHFRNLRIKEIPAKILNSPDSVDV